MNFKIKMFKNIISVLCATVIATSGVVTSVGAIDEEKVNQILKNIDNCDNRIKDLEQNKARINEQKENEIKKLDSEIKDSEQLLEYLLNLIADGEDHEVDCNRVERSIEDNRQKKKQINDDSVKDIHDLDEMIKQSRTEKDKLELELNNLLNQPAAEPIPNNQVHSENEFAELWKQLASGCQHDPTGRYESLCWLMSARNVLNFFGGAQQPAILPVQGVQNVVDDYLNRGGNRACLNNNMQDDASIGQWLNRNEISTLNVTDCTVTGNFNNENDAKKKLIEIVKDQIITHFDANNKPNNKISPIISGGHNHWITIVGYYKNTNNVVVVDSLNGYKNESKIFVKNIDKLIEEKLITNQGEAWITELIFTAKKNNVGNSEIFVSSIDNFGGQNIAKNQISQFF